MKIVVTGGAGFIGSNVALELEKLKNDVIIADSLFSSTLDNLKEFKGEFLKLDTSNKKITTIKDIDAIFHQSAITDPRFGDDDETLKKNIDGFENVLKLAKNTGAKLIYASTANLYGNGPLPMKEDQKKEIISAYGKSKLIMDEISKKYFEKMHIVGLRYFNVFGPREMHKGRPASMISHLWKKMVCGEKPRLFKYGEQKRDHIYVKDVVYANLLALDAPSGIYNVGTGRATSFNEIVHYLNEILNTNYEIEYFDSPYDPKTYQMNTQADTERASKSLKFKSKFGVKEGIKDYDIFLRKYYKK